MANNDKDLVLYLPLYDIRGDGTVQDASDFANHGAVKGNPTLVPDDAFGGSLSLNVPQPVGDYISVPVKGLGTGNHAHTIEGWIYPNGLPKSGRSWPLLLGPAGKGSHHWLLHPDGTTNLGMWLGATFGPKIDTDKWTHIAMVHDGKLLKCYVNGILQGDPKTATFELKSTDLTIAKAQNGGVIGESDFSGKIVNLRIYGRALSQAEIQRDISIDQMSLVAFRKSHPIDFSLYDDDEQPVLYITDGTDARNLNLELLNTSTQTIQFTNGQSATASADNHHFALRFRPGTLSDSTLNSLTNPQERAKILKGADEWDLYFPSTLPAANETASLYLLYKGPSKSFNYNERRVLTLQGLSAAPGNGARGTQVELIPRQLTAAGSDATLITGSRSQYVHITNHQGKKNIPLHVGFVDGNVVLNDGQSTNNLRLRITNVSQDGAITLTAKSSHEPSRFIISFDVDPNPPSVDPETPPGIIVKPPNKADAPRPMGEPDTPLVNTERQSKEWALVSKGVSANMSVVVYDNPTQSKNGREIRGEGLEGDTPEWPITFDAPISLAPGQHISVDINKIKSSLPTGHANLYVRYENIPGYWDGQFVCAVEKGPIVPVKGKVGIGTTTPNAKVEVAGGVVAESLSVERANGRRGGVFLATAGDFNHVIYNNYSNFDGEGGWDGAKWNTGNGLQLKVGFTAPKKLALAIDVNGNVGIGKSSVGEKLEVDGTVKATKFDGEGAFVKGMIVMWSGASDAIPKGWALCDGNNGTPNLAEKFIVGAGGKYKARDTGGTETVSLQVQHMPKHTHAAQCATAGAHGHAIRGSNHGWAWTDTVSLGDGNQVAGALTIPEAGNHTHTISITEAGGGGAHENRPPYYAMAFIMKL